MIGLASFRNELDGFCAIEVDFFFQAEDGIRDLTVTGVQTCALPICGSPNRLASPRRHQDGSRTSRARRSEERRVGKECRSRRSQYHLKKKPYTLDTSVRHHIKRYVSNNVMYPPCPCFLQFTAPHSSM